MIVKAGAFKARVKIALPAAKDVYLDVTEVRHSNATRLGCGFPKWGKKMCSAEMAFALSFELFGNQFCLSLASFVACTTDGFQLEKRRLNSCWCNVIQYFFTILIFDLTTCTIQ